MTKKNLFTPKELEIISLVCDGLTNLQISERMGNSHNTTKNRMTIIYQKKGVENRAEAIIVALTLGKQIREPLLQKFVLRMESRLKGNYWKDRLPFDLLRELAQRYDDVSKSYIYEEDDKFIDKLADLANIAMMLSTVLNNDEG